MLVGAAVAGVAASPAHARPPVIGGYTTVVQPAEGDRVLVGSRLTGPCGGNPETGNFTFTAFGVDVVGPPACTPTPPVAVGNRDPQRTMTTFVCTADAGCPASPSINFTIWDTNMFFKEKDAFDHAARNYLYAESAAEVAAFGCLLFAGPAIVPCAIATIGVAVYVHREYARLHALAADPPDPAYRVIATPHPAKVAPVPSSSQIPPGAARALYALFLRQARVTGLEEALLHSIERSAGADASGATDAPGWQQRHNAAARGFALAIAREYDALPGLRAAAGRALRAAGFRIRVNRAQAIAVQRRLKAKGLPAVLRKVFAERGGDPAELVRLVLAASPSTLTSRIPDLYLDPKLTAADRSAARTMRSFADHVAPHA